MTLNFNIRATVWFVQLIFVTDQNGRSMLYSDRILFSEKGMSPAFTFDVFR